MFIRQVRVVNRYRGKPQRGIANTETLHECFKSAVVAGVTEAASVEQFGSLCPSLGSTVFLLWPKSGFEAANTLSDSFAQLGEFFGSKYQQCNSEHDQ